MAPRKPSKPAPKAIIKAPAKAAPKPAAKPVVKAAVKPLPKPVVQPVAKPVAKPALAPLPQPELMHDHNHAACCTPRTTGLGCLTSCCPMAKVLFTRSFWAAAVVAFFVIFATDWLLHTKFLMQDYAQSSSLWRAEGEIRHSLIFITQALTAMVYAAIIIGLGFSHRWFGSFSSGVLAAGPAAISAMTAYVMLPFAVPYIPTVWAVASLLQGGLVGLAVCAALHLSRAPDVTDCCPPRSTLH